MSLYSTIAFTNGTLNTNNFKFNDFTSNDYNSMDYNYTPNTSTLLVENIINQIIPNKESRKIFYNFLYNTIMDKTTNKVIYLKKNDYLINLIQNTFGYLAHKMNTKLFNNFNINQEEEKRNSLFKLKNKPLCLLEFDKKEDITNGIHFINAIRYKRNIVLLDNLYNNIDVELNCNLIVFIDDHNLNIKIDESKCKLLSSINDKSLYNQFINLLFSVNQNQ